MKDVQDLIYCNEKNLLKKKILIIGSMKTKIKIGKL